MPASRTISPRAERMDQTLSHTIEKDGVEIRLVPCLSDNYAVLMHDGADGTTVLVDAPEPGPILAALGETGWRLTDILLTHHHHDHVQGVAALVEATGARVHGPAAEADRMPPLDEALADGDTVRLGRLEARCIATPGHTSGPLSYHFAGLGVAFTGDTLFALGCGRLFEGTPETMWDSLSRLRSALPDDTLVYCGHEYTLSNARFALTVEPGNEALVARARAVEAARAEGRPTVPFTMGEDRATNPFLRADAPSVAAVMPTEGRAPPAAVFAEIRRRKDSFR